MWWVPAVRGHALPGPLEHRATPFRTPAPVARRRPGPCRGRQQVCVHSTASTSRGIAMVGSQFRRIRRRSLVGALCALALTVGGVALVSQAGGALAATVGSPTPIIGGQSGRCVDVPNSSTANGTQVQLYDCGGQAGQAWTLTSGNQLQIFGSKCLDANGRGTTNGTQVII